MGVLSIMQNQNIKYRRLRGDFDVEHDNNCEDLISVLDDEINPNQYHSTELLQLRTSLCDGYQQRLNERNRRKRFLQMNHSLDFNRFANEHKILSKCLQLSSQKGIEKLQSGISLEQSIKTRITQLEKCKNVTKSSSSSAALEQLPSQSTTSFSPSLLSTIEQSTILPKTKFTSKKFTTLKVTSLVKNNTTTSKSKILDDIKLYSTSKEHKLVQTYITDQNWVFP